MLTFSNNITNGENIMVDKPKYYEDMTKSEMVKIISESTGIKLPALERATKIDISNIAKALKVSANYKGAN
jgi:hypothetical protein|tara:strand:- start:2696 stop:2908 length:213 start_codon:yes stop_codon:yes gene_type:complete